MKLARWGLPLAGAALLVLTLCGLALHVPGADSVGSVALTNRFVALAAIAGLVHLLACALVLRAAPPPHAIWLVLGVALALRLPLLTAPPFLSSDVYRYVWDGRVQQAGINPYRYIPADPALAGLRDRAVYPHINRRTYAPTIYPPMAQLIFRMVVALDASVGAMRVAMLGFEALAIACLLALLRRAGLPSARVLIYAWNPLAVWSFAGNGHVDAAAAGLIAASLLCHARGREGVAGALLAAATLVKFLPLVIAPSLWRPFAWRAPLAFIAVTLGLYGCYLEVGWRVFGFLGQYGGEEGFARGGGFWMLEGVAEWASLPAWASRAYVLAAAGVLLWLALAITMRNRARLPQAKHVRRLCRQAAWLGFAAMLLLSPHYSWYYPFLGMFAVVAPVAPVLWLSVAPLLLDLDPFRDPFLWRALVFVPAIGLAVRDLWRDLWPARLMTQP